jgi:hypothetical protein
MTPKFHVTELYEAIEKEKLQGLTLKWGNIIAAEMKKLNA